MRRLDRLASLSQVDFELDFFEKILTRSPNYVDVLRVHGNNLTAAGHYERGLDTDRRLVRLRPQDPLAHYNLACSYSLLHMKDAAIVSLEASLNLGYRDVAHVLRDPDLENIRGDARFRVLLSRYGIKVSNKSRRIR